MINPLNELSSVYMQSIAEDCSKCEYCGGKGCSKCDDKKGKVVLKGSSSVDGGDAAKPGKDKNYVKPMATEGHCAVDGVECSPTEKKKDAKRMKKESVYSNWRDDSQELLEYISGSNGLGSGVEDDEKNLENPKAKTVNKSNQKIIEKSVKNKIKINPPQGVTEGFAKLGGVVTEMYEITEKIDIAKVDMGDVVKDFRKSDAPQFKGKSDKKKQQMAVAAKLATEETDEEKKKREMLAKTKEHDDKKSGKLAEADMTGAPSIKDAKPAKKTNVKYDSHMKVMAPSIKEGVLSGALSTLRAKNGIKTVTAKGADKLQDKKDKTMGEENKMSAFDVVKKQIKDKYGEKSLIDTKAPKKQPSPEQRKADAQRRSKNYSDNTKNDNPYKARAGESD